MTAAIELSSLLRVSGCSLTLYDKISFWLQNRISYLIMELLPTWDKVIKIMEEWWHSFQCVAPQKKEVVFAFYKFTYWDSGESTIGMYIFSIIQWKFDAGKNLIFCDPKQLFITEPFNNQYSEVNTGLAYQSFQKRIKHFGNAVQIPIIIFIDGTAIDWACCHSQTPVMFTLGIFKTNTTQ